MKLTKLELSGFKSFADTVTLTFEQGVTAIVGPNGCGKSNVSDSVRWVLGEQSARLLRGGKMEDVIFQGSAARRPVNVTEVSLFLDNSDGDLPIAYREVVVTRRLSRSGQSDYLLNGSPVRLRDIQDLLRGTGLGSDAGVVIEAKMIDLLLSDRAEERRSLFEEAAGIGLYRDRKHSTERRLEETAVDLQRVEDLIAEVQSQIRSLARQRGKAERHAKLSEEKFAVQLTLARRHMDRLTEEAAGMEARFRDLADLLPAARRRLTESDLRRDESARTRAAAEAQRTEMMHRLATIRVELGKLDGDLALAAERLSNATGQPDIAGPDQQETVVGAHVGAHCVRPSVRPYRFLLIWSRNVWLALKAGTTDALMFTALPVRGSRHSRAARFRDSKLPNPLMATLPPRLSSDAIMPVGAKNSSAISFALAFVRPSRLATVATSSRLFTRAPGRDGE